jgi:hypothetical protein
MLRSLKRAEREVRETWERASPPAKAATLLAGAVTAAALASMLYTDAAPSLPDPAAAVLGAGAAVQGAANGAAVLGAGAGNAGPSAFPAPADPSPAHIPARVVSARTTPPAVPAYGSASITGRVDRATGKERAVLIGLLAMLLLVWLGYALSLGNVAVATEMLGVHLETSTAQLAATSVSVELPVMDVGALALTASQAASGFVGAFVAMSHELVLTNAGAIPIPAYVSVLGPELRAKALRLFGALEAHALGPRALGPPAPHRPVPLRKGFAVVATYLAGTALVHKRVVGDSLALHPILSREVAPWNPGDVGAVLREVGGLPAGGGQYAHAITAVLAPCDPSVAPLLLSMAGLSHDEIHAAISANASLLASCYDSLQAATESGGDTEGSGAVLGAIRAVFREADAVAEAAVVADPAAVAETPTPVVVAEAAVVAETAEDAARLEAKWEHVREYTGMNSMSPENRQSFVAQVIFAELAANVRGSLAHARAEFANIETRTIEKLNVVLAGNSDIDPTVDCSGGSFFGGAYADTLSDAMRATIKEGNSRRWCQVPCVANGPQIGAALEFLVPNINRDNGKWRNDALLRVLRRARDALGPADVALQVVYDQAISDIPAGKRVLLCAAVACLGPHGRSLPRFLWDVVGYALSELRKRSLPETLAVLVQLVEKDAEAVRNEGFLDDKVEGRHFHTTTLLGVLDDLASGASNAAVTSRLFARVYVKRAPYGGGPMYKSTEGWLAAVEEEMRVVMLIGMRTDADVQVLVHLCTSMDIKYTMFMLAYPGMGVLRACFRDGVDAPSADEARRVLGIGPTKDAKTAANDAHKMLRFIFHPDKHRGRPWLGFVQHSFILAQAAYEIIQSQ